MRPHRFLNVMPVPKFKLRHRLLLFCFSLLLSLVVAEVGLIVAGFSFRVAPESVEFGWPDPKVMKDLYRGDPDLFWVPKSYPDIITNLSEKKVDILFMGDSCTEFSRWPQLFVEKAKMDNPNQSFFGQVLAVGGWTSYQGKQQLQRDIIPLQPKAVTIFFGWNDHWMGFGLEDKEIHQVLQSPLYQFSQFRLIQALLKVQLGNKIKAQNQNNKTIVRVPISDFRTNLVEMVTQSQKAGIVPILLTAPSSHTEGKEPPYLSERFLADLSQLVPLHQSYVSVVREVANEYDAPLCDLAEKFDNIPNREEYFKFDGIHFNEQGDIQIAALLYECLQNNPKTSVLWDR